MMVRDEDEDGEREGFEGGVAIGIRLAGRIGERDRRDDITWLGWRRA